MFFIIYYRVIRRGFEPRTDCLEGSCSIQLSYQTIIILYDKGGESPSDHIKSGAKIVKFDDISKLFA